MKKKKAILLGLAGLIILGLIGFCVYWFGFHLPQARKQAELETQIREYREAKLASYRAENEKYEDYQVDVAFLGDSLTDGYDLETFYPQYLTANRGIGGDRTYDLKARLQVSVYDLKPKVAVMLIGANNFQTMFEDYEDILIGLKENLPETKIVLLSLTSMGQEWGKNNHLAAYNNVKIKLLAEKYEFRYVDLYTPLLDPDTDQIHPEYTTDGGHLTQEGYRVFTDTLTPVLKELLGK